MNKITLDFENEVVTIQTISQNGTHHHPGLAKLEPKVLSLLGYQKLNLAPIVEIFEKFLDGQISKEEMDRQLARYEDEDDPKEK